MRLEVAVSSENPVEIEAKLVVTDEGAGRAFDEIRRLTHVAGFGIEPDREIAIADTYFDTGPGALAAARYGLRLRRSEGALQVTLKGPAREVEGGALERFEYEAPYTEAAVDTALEALRSRGVRIPERITRDRRSDLESGGSDASDDAEPYASAARQLRGCGFEVLQTREVVRAVRIVRGETGGEAIAELALDRVRFRTPAGVVVHEEVEVEAAAGGRVAVVADVVRGLRAAVPGLRPFRHDKLAVGLALDALAREGELARYVSAEGRLDDAGRERVARRIERMRSGT